MLYPWGILIPLEISPVPQPPRRPSKAARQTHSSPLARKPSPRSGANYARHSIHRNSGGVDDGLERLQKVLAAAGLGSRRSCEELITSGRVEVDHEIVTTLGSKVDPVRQQIRVDGERLPNPRRTVYLLNKPVGVVTTNYDPSGRPRVIDLVPADQRLFPVGRLDRASEGLILVTNDGELGNLLTHPRYGVEKKYLVQIAGVPTAETVESLRQGVSLAEATVQAKRVSVRSQHKQSTVLEMVLDEGRNREIRRMLASLGHKVQQLKRIAVGDLTLGNLLPGQWRKLSWEEIERLRQAATAAVGENRAQRPRTNAPKRTYGGRSRTNRENFNAPAGPRPGGQAGNRRPKRPGKASSWRKRAR